MTARYIRPEVDYQKEVPNAPFTESSNPINESVNLQTSLGPIELGDLTVVRGKLRVKTGVSDTGDHDYGVF